MFVETLNQVTAQTIRECQGSKCFGEYLSHAIGIWCNQLNISQDITDYILRGYVQPEIKDFTKYIYKEGKTEMNNWGISIANEPLIINAIKMDVGNILLAANDQGRVSFNLEAAGNDLDRRIQAPMYSQPEIKSWTVLFNIKFRS